MEVDEDRNVLRDLGEDAVHRLERILDGIHEDLPLHVDDGEAESRHRDEAPALARTFRRVVGGTDQAVDAADLSGELLLSPRVVAERDRVRTCLEDFLRQRRGDARAGRAVLAINNCCVDAALRLQLLQLAL